MPAARNIRNGVDHAIILVDDLDRARTQFEAAGFCVCNRASHKNFGTANHLLIFENMYLELMGVVDAEPLDKSSLSFLTEHFAAGGGLRVFALTSNDAMAEYRRLSDQDYNLEAPARWSRTISDIETDDEVSFTTMFLPQYLTPLAPMFFCQHHNPELVYRREVMSHPNGIARVDGITVPVKDISDCESIYIRLFPDARVVADDRGLTINFDGFVLTFLMADQFTDLVTEITGQSEQKITGIVSVQKAGTRAPDGLPLFDPDKTANVLFVQSGEGTASTRDAE